MTRGLDAEHLDVLRAHPFAVMATLHADGRPQLSLVQQHYQDGVCRVSLTAARAKTRNLRRDPRVGLLVMAGGVEHFVVAEGHAELSDIARAPGDEVAQGLEALYRALAGEHPDWDDYARAMIDQRRLVCSVHISRTYAGHG